MNIDRYDPESNDYGDTYMLNCADGDWVPFAAYESLENDYNVLRREYAIMMEKIKAIWVEG